MSLVTLGTMTFGRPVDFDQAAELVEYAVNRGITVFDTANMYEGYDRSPGSSGGVAEEILGRALAPVREKMVIATKLGMKVGPQPEDEGTSAGAVRKQLSASLRRLKTDYVDLYYLHKPGPPEELEETLRELERARREKAIRCYGVSNFSAEELARLLETSRKLGLPGPSICQPALSLLKQEALENLLPLCVREGIAVTPYQIYQGGLLTGKYKRAKPMPAGSRGKDKPDWLWQMDDSLFDTLEAYESEAEKHSMGLAEYALNWALWQPGVVSAIVGVTSKSQIDLAVESVKYQKE